MSESRLRPMFFEAHGLDIEKLESYGTEIVATQKGVMWWLGDCARQASALFPDTWEQVFPAGVSPGLIARAKAVAEHYPNEADRNPLATWTIHAQNANRPDRIQRVQAHVDEGHTSDEARKADAAERKEGDRPRWLLAVDVNYHLCCHWFSGAGVEAASQVAEWVGRLTKRLKEKGLTDVACCFDSPNNFRKALTADWEDKYKPRPPKAQELVQQLGLVRELLDGRGFCCAALDTFEADDMMASYAAQFDGRVTLLTPDKDMRQCLSDTCNMLLNTKWTEDDASGEKKIEYEWVSAKQHNEATGIRPNQWAAYQAIWGDGADGIKGCPGIGEKGAAELIKEFGTVAAVIHAAKNDDERINEKKRKALIAFEPLLDITRQLVTLRTDLTLPENTRI